MGKNMKISNKELENKLRKAFTAVSPNVLDRALETYRDMSLSQTNSKRDNTTTHGTKTETLEEKKN